MADGAAVATGVRHHSAGVCARESARVLSVLALAARRVHAFLHHQRRCDQENAEWRSEAGCGRCRRQSPVSEGCWSGHS
eukprot:2084404-Rhodomonas_salina.2